MTNSTRQIRVANKTYTVQFSRRPGHSQSCRVRIDGTLYRSDLTGFGMDGATVASLIRVLEANGIQAIEL